MPRTAALISALVLGLLSPAQSQTRPDRIRLGMAGLEPGMGGVWVAQETGIFRDQGLDVEIVTFGGGTEGIQALVAGQLALMVVGGPAAINAMLGGAQLRLVGEIMGTIPFILVSTPEIATGSDLRGKSVAVGRFGGAADFAARLAIRRLGLEPGRDVALTQVGGSAAARVAALRSGTVLATVLSLAEAQAARSLGFRELMDLAALNLSFPYEEVVATTAFIRDHPETLRRFLRGLVLGTRRFKTQREEAILVLGKYLENRNPAVLSESYLIHAKLIREKPAVALEGIRTILDEIGQINPRARTANPADFVDPRFVRELIESGFIDRAYR